MSFNPDTREHKWALRDGRPFGTSQNHAARMAADTVKSKLDIIGAIDLQSVAMTEWLFAGT